MTDENDGQEPPANPVAQPSGQPPVLPTTPPQNEVRENPQNSPEPYQGTAKELAREFRWIEVGTLVINGVLAIVGVIALTIYNGQLQQMRAAGDQTERSLVLTRGQLAIADRTARLSERAMKTQQRAWMDIFNVNTPDAVQVGATVTAFADIKNYGPTPAHHVINSDDMRVFCGGFPQTPPYRSGSNPGVFKRGSIDKEMPGTWHNTGAVTIGPFTTADMQKLNDHSCAIYFYGKVEYCDIFGEAHYSHSCAMWLPGTKNTFVGCDKYNDADSDYPNKPPVACKP